MTRVCLTVPQSLIGVALCALGLAFHRAPAQACAGLGRSGPIFVRGEEALVVWDSAHRTEHFIRRALFEDVTEDFGFLVPTPTRPELAEVTPRIFLKLFELYRGPRPREERRVRFRREASDASEVMVLEERTVAGMDAAILAATDAGALDGWLRQHGYPNGPTLQSYLAPYVASGWIITAFRIAPGTLGTQRFSSAAVRMSFATDRPFFPYSEPQDGAAPRHFRVSVVAPRRMSAFLDRPAGGARAEWRGAAYAGQPTQLSRILAPVLPARVSGSRWLTTFDEPQSQRGTLDLFFEPDPSQRRLVSSVEDEIRP